MDVFEFTSRLKDPCTLDKIYMIWKEYTPGHDLHMHSMTRQPRDSENISADGTHIGQRIPMYWTLRYDSTLGELPIRSISRGLVDIVKIVVTDPY